MTPWESDVYSMECAMNIQPGWGRIAHSTSDTDTVTALCETR